MFLFRLYAFCILSALFSFFGGEAASQTSPDNEDRKTDFTVSTGLNISLAGAQTFTRFQLTDELGHSYDVMSLLSEPSTREALQLDPATYAKMLKIKLDTKNELTAQVAGALIAEDGKKKLEARFRESEESLLDHMNDDQIAQLELIRVKQGIEQFGLTEYLGSKAMKNEFGLSDMALTSLSDRVVESKSNHANRVKRWLREANLELLNELSDDKRALFDQAIGEKGAAKFIATTLFVKGKSLQKIATTYKRTLLLLLRKSSEVAKLKLDPERKEALAAQLPTLKKMSKAEFKQSLAELLTPDQLRHLHRLGIAYETRRYGTVNALAYGLLSKEIGLGESENRSLYRKGEQLAKELRDGIADSEKESVVNSLDVLTAQQKDRLSKILVR